MIDNRVVVPLDKVNRVAGFYCQSRCPRRGEGEHLATCLVPLLEDRDRRLGIDPKILTYGISPDCAGNKHAPVCTGTGCDCVCHHP